MAGSGDTESDKHLDSWPVVSEEPVCARTDDEGSSNGPQSPSTNPDDLLVEDDTMEPRLSDANDVNEFVIEQKALTLEDLKMFYTDFSISSARVGGSDVNERNEACQDSCCVEYYECTMQDVSDTEEESIASLVLSNIIECVIYHVGQMDCRFTCDGDASQTTPEGHMDSAAGSSGYESNDGKRFRCDICQFRASKAYVLLRHLRIHTRERPYVCKVCGFSSSDRGSLKTHATQHLAHRRPFACDVCNYRARHKRDLAQHRRKHTGAAPRKPFRCELCPYAARKPTHLRRHAMTHGDERPYQCAFCDYATKDPSSLRQHEFTHSAVKPYMCTLCDYTSTQASNLKRHVATHIDCKPYACDDCDFTSKYKSSLKLHQVKHSDKEPYSCEYCSYTSYSSSNINRHKITHNEEKRYPCSDESCQYRTNRLEQLKSHILRWHST